MVFMFRRGSIGSLPLASRARLNGPKERGLDQLLIRGQLEVWHVIEIDQVALPYARLYAAGRIDSEHVVQTPDRHISRSRLPSDHWVFDANSVGFLGNKLISRAAGTFVACAAGENTTVMPPVFGLTSRPP